MYKKYRVPIGLIGTAWGGTPVESWMSKDALICFPAKIAEGEQYADSAKREEVVKNTEKEIEKWEKDLIQKDSGLINEWQNLKTDISNWDEITLPGDFAEAGLKEFCGVIWLAKDFNVDADFASQKARVWLGTIVDSDIVYINGVEIGGTGYRYPPRKYNVNAGVLKEGKNRIVVRVTCRNGEGGIERDKPFRIFTDNDIKQFSGTWKFKAGAAAPPRPEEFFFQRQPMGNFNAMISPLMKYRFKGVIWYQGESNDSDPRDYAVLFKKMIQDWREKNGETLPFLFVQLPIWKEPSDNDENSSWAIIREAQASALSLPDTGMAAALELGEWNDLHPLNKKDVGIRLFLAAEKTLFKIENTSPGPILRRFEKNKKKIFLYFDNCGEGLKTSGEKCHVSAIGSETLRLPAEIEGKDAVSIDISTVKNPQKILYAWACNPRDRQLFNSEGLPAIPFRIKIN
jgi:sialate O-acetylesterase